MRSSKLFDKWYFFPDSPRWFTNPHPHLADQYGKSYWCVSVCVCLFTCIGGIKIKLMITITIWFDFEVLEDEEVYA